MLRLYFSIICLIFSSNIFATEENQPAPVLLAKIYRSDINLQDYWVSEKYDGVRAYWNGKQLISRQGNNFSAPPSFIHGLPNLALDGELWLGRGRFEQLSGLVRRQSANKSDWSEIKYMVFDLPGSKRMFDQRLQQLKAIISDINQPHIQLVPQYKITTHEILLTRLEDVVNQGGEGLMLHRGASFYKSWRSEDLLKLKKYQDAEAVVIKHYPGKGKFESMLGSMEVETADGKKFRIGSGFSDDERNNPPAIGSIITYKYFGLTRNGIPRFANFLRKRKDF